MTSRFSGTLQPLASAVQATFHGMGRDLGAVFDTTPSLVDDTFIGIDHAGNNEEKEDKEQFCHGVSLARSTMIVSIRA
jgi:hypothetical protein